MLKKVTIAVSVVLLSGCGKQTAFNTPSGDQLENEQAQNQENERGIRSGGEGRPDGERPEDGSGRRMNFAEAQEACTDKEERAACQYVVTNEGQDDKEITGTCKSSMQMENKEEGLSCRPERKDVLRRGVTKDITTEETTPEE